MSHNIQIENRKCLARGTVRSRCCNSGLEKTRYKEMKVYKIINVSGNN